MTHGPGLGRDGDLGRARPPCRARRPGSAGASYPSGRAGGRRPAGQWGAPRDRGRRRRSRPRRATRTATPSSTVGAADRQHGHGGGQLDVDLGPQLEPLQPGDQPPPPPGIGVEPKASSARPRSTRSQASTLPWGWSTNDAGRVADRQRGHVLAELALEEGRGVGPGDRDDVAGGPGDGGVHARSVPAWARLAAVMRRAAGTAASRARALLWHSRSSCSGTESATMPAPAWTEARPSGRHDHGADGDGGVEVAARSRGSRRRRRTGPAWSARGRR